MNVLGEYGKRRPAEGQKSKLVSYLKRGRMYLATTQESALPPGWFSSFLSSLTASRLHRNLYMGLSAPSNNARAGWG